MPNILVIARDPDLRQSLQFALEAEGYAVTWRPGIGAPGQLHHFDCTVVDHHALGDDWAATLAFCVLNRPVVLLANSLVHPLSPNVFRTVLKPMLGAALSEAIRDALATQTIAPQNP
jgi:hypothetical protein